MAISLYLHIAGEEPIVVDVEKLPDPQDQIIICMNPRKRDGKEANNILAEVNTIIYPWWRINFIEILPGKDEDEIYGFYRD
ncbi:hypothetical protein ACFLYO_08405 [Chloroflexota bacterium]